MLSGFLNALKNLWKNESQSNTLHGKHFSDRLSLDKDREPNSLGFRKTIQTAGVHSGVNGKL